MTRSLLILVAGPYRSGTNDRPELIANNLATLEAAALEVYERGHVPLIGEWAALPLMKRAGSRALGDEIYQKYSYPVADRMLEHCDGVLRLPGASVGADGDVRVAQSLGIRVYTSIDEIAVRDGSQSVSRESLSAR